MQNWRTPGIILLSGAFVLCISLGVRHAFGIFLQPMSMDMGWGREAFALSIAIQNLVWGIAQPIVGRISDKSGAGLVVLFGAILYALGLYMMSQVTTEWGLIISAGVIIGLGLSGTTFPVVFGAISRAMPVEKRSWAMGVSMAIGSFGQFLFLPGSHMLILDLGWSTALLVLAVISALMLPLSIALMEPAKEAKTHSLQLREILSEAATHKGFWLLSFGFFVCGFQVVFIATHLPAFLVDSGVSASTGAFVLGLIGLFNIAGSYLAGHFGGRISKPLLLSGIYSARFVVIALFLLFPVTQFSAWVFGILMGLLWLSTVPLTNGTVATLFGVENMSMLGGIVFLFHQIGAFLGGWLGGYLYDVTGDYNSVWGIAMALSVIATLLNLPIREQPVPRILNEQT